MLHFPVTVHDWLLARQQLFLGLMTYVADYFPRSMTLNLYMRLK